MLDVKCEAGMDMSIHIGKVNSIITDIKTNGGLDLEKVHAVIMLRSVRDAGSAFESVVAAMKAQEEGNLLQRRLTGIDRNCEGL